ncbi:putative integral membrane protein [Cadophora sp. MPI-SDFR-AT-0126]|nr:putative integral membrane protein [Leotiomycetes sp. MPI-SDFR-AT-0126]
MKGHLIVVWCFACLLCLVRTDSSIMASLPSCALTCMSDLISSSGCLVTDQSCICSNRNLNENISICLMTKCTLRDSLTTKNISSTMCGEPIRTKPDIIGLVSLTVVAFTAVLLRLLARAPTIGAGSIGMDDWTIFVAALLLVPYTVYCFDSRYYGLGTDIWTIPFKHISKLLYNYYVAEVIYAQLTALTKSAILFFYLRIFPPTISKRLLYAIITFCLTYGITFSLTFAFQCLPVPYSWNGWDGEHSGKCMNRNAMVWSQSTINTGLDLVIILLPLPCLVKLNLSWRKKIFICLMFSVGFFITVVSCIRLAQVVEFGGTTNPSWDWYGIGVWSIVEVDVSILCACMPALLALLRHFWPAAFGNTTDENIPASSPCRRPPESSQRLSHTTRSNCSDFVQLMEMGDHGGGNETYVERV